MKKVYLSTMTLLVGVIGIAQMQPAYNVQKITPATNTTQTNVAVNNDRAGGDPIPGYQDDFSNASNWLTPADGNGHAWQIGINEPADIPGYMGSMASTTQANGFAAFDGISHLLAVDVDPQDAVLEYNTTMNLTAYPAVLLQFEQRYRAFNTDQTFVEVSNNNGTSYTQYEINTSYATNSPAVQNTMVMNISAIAGGASQVRVRFRWFNTSDDDQYGSGYGWMIDDFGLYEAYSYDLVNEASFHRSGVGTIYATGLEYYMIPTSQVTQIHFAAKVKNDGALTHTGAQLNVTVDKTTNVYTGTSAAADMPANSSDSITTTTTYTPASGLGVYDVTYWVDGTNTEEVTNNDTMYDAFELTDVIYARDNNQESGGISAVSSNPNGVLQIGNVFEIFGSGTIGGAQVKLTDAGGNVGKLMYVYLYKYDAGVGDYVLAASSADYTVQNGDVDSWVQFFFDNAVDVVSGDDILLVAGHYGDQVEFAMAQGVDEQTVLGYIDGSAFYLSSPQAIMIRADFTDYTGVEELSNNNFSIGQNVPNPFNGTSVISYTLNETANVNVQITDVAGKVVQTYTPGVQNAGTYNLTIDGTTLADGIYYYTFTVGETTVTKQMVVSNK